MSRTMRGWWRSALLMLAAVVLMVAAGVASAQPAINPNTLGKGEWVYIIGSARTSAGVTTNQQFMDYLRNKGVKWVVVKCGDYGTWWTQFDSSLITAAHNSGLLIFGYQRVGGTNLTAEINVGKQCLASGADGYIVDAEVEFNGKNTQATQMMQSLRATYPNAFIAHSPLPYIDYHTTFPYVEFGTYCDAVMPQCYWLDIGVTPTKMLQDLNDQWKKWHTTWKSQGKGAAVKPLIPIAQGHAKYPEGTALNAAQVTEFCNLLKADTAPANPSGPWTGVSFWSAQHHTASVWTAIGGVTCNPYTGGTTQELDNGGPGHSESGTWTTSTSAGFFGTNSRYASVGGSAVATWTPTVGTAGNYEVYAWWVQGSNRSTSARYRVTHAGGTTDWNANQTANGGQWNLIGTFPLNVGTSAKVELLAASSTGGSVVIADAIKIVFKTHADVIVDNTSTQFTASTNWATSTSPTGFYGTNCRTRSTASVSDSATWNATLPVTGTYQVYGRWTSATNRSTTAPFVITHAGGSATVNVNQQLNGGTWVLLGTYTFNEGTSQRVRLSCWTTTGFTVCADAIKFVAQ